jgi:hypothetical protein
MRLVLLVFDAYGRIENSKRIFILPLKKYYFAWLDRDIAFFSLHYMALSAGY